MGASALRIALATSLLLVAGCQRELELPAEPVPPQVVKPGVECLTDEDCVLGLCGVDQKCDPSRCAEDSDCASGGCRMTGLCAFRECSVDADCGVGRLCVDGGDKDRVCGPGCRDDDGCPTGQSCVMGGGTYGSCTMATCTDAPVLQGDPAALRMTDNLAAAVAYAQGREPDAALIRAGGYGVRADGTVDITDGADQTARWTYAFQIGDGSRTPQRFSSVTYYVVASSVCGEYDPDGTGVGTGTPVPQDTWTQWRDATELVPSFSAGPGCVALTGATSDYVVYDHLDGAPRFLVGNWQGDFGVADPVTGDFSHLDCD